MAELDTKNALKHPKGLCFLWLLEKIAPEEVANKKRRLITDEKSLLRVIGYCASKGTILSRGEIKTRDIEFDELEKFIDINEAQSRIKAFLNKDGFAELPQDDKMNVMAFLLGMERKGEGERNKLNDPEILEKLKELKGSC